VPRKPNKLPYDTISASYELEYGTDTLEIHTDAIRKGDRVLIHDDVLATGGTAASSIIGGGIGR
jgi:adenine phosphoribosyltransferase